ncbi:MAG: arginine repressor [Clostridia bacterium]|nr:arginine repressor [Clostridia bacterium]
MKSERHQKILELIREKDICTQEELAKELVSAGFCVTQATVSRDIRELRLFKTGGDGEKQKYAVSPNGAVQKSDKFLRVLKEGFVSMDMAQNILVIKTVSGMAMAVAAALDSMDWNEIVGCIAGDDTIMCAVRTVEDTYRIMDKIKRIIHR